MRLGPVRWRDVVGRPAWRWGTVSSTGPLTVLLDGDDEGAMPVQPGNVLVSGLQSGDRVYCQMVGAGTAKHIIILGRSGG